jgi:hypothetical protein
VLPSGKECPSVCFPEVVGYELFQNNFPEFLVLFMKNEFI